MMFTYSLESELHQHIVENFEVFFDFNYISSEFRINSGRVDIIGKSDDKLYIIELKRDIIDQCAIDQLSNYLSEIIDDKPNKEVIGIAAAPKVKQNLNLNGLPIKTLELSNVHYNSVCQTLITISKEKKERLERIAKDEKRSFSNLIDRITDEFLKEYDNNQSAK